MFKAWPEITSFANVRKFALAYPNQFPKEGTIPYRAKVKLDGTNAAIHLIKENGVTKILTQSRTKLITPEDDNFGFAKFVQNNKDAWTTVRSRLNHDLLIFGEFAGKSINSGTAINQIEKKIFAIFAVQDLRDNIFITEPWQIENLIGKIDDVYIIPWHSYIVSIPWLESEDKLNAIIDSLNGWVKEVEDCDPFVFKNFNVEGVGEGLVFSPTNCKSLDEFGNYSFKAKGEKHKVVATKKAVQVNVEKTNSVEGFVALVCTIPRLEQGVKAVAGGELTYENKFIGGFLKWVEADIKKECQAELEASGLKLEDVSKAIQIFARSYYMKKVNKL